MAFLMKGAAISTAWRQQFHSFSLRSEGAHARHPHIHHYESVAIRVAQTVQMLPMCCVGAELGARRCLPGEEK